MTLKIKVSDIKNVLIYILLFLAAMNFQAKFFYFVYISFFVILATQKRLGLNRTSLLYLCVCGIMSLYNSDEGLLSMLRCFAPICFYLVGLNIVLYTYSGKDCALLQEVEKKGYLLLTFICAGSFFHYALNYLNNLGTSMGRNTIDIWTGARMAATGQNALACLMMGFSVSMLFLPQKRGQRIIAVMIIFLMLLYNLVLSTRTMIVIFAVLIMIGLFYTQRRTIPGIQRKRSLTTMALLVAVAILVYVMNIADIQEHIKKSLLFGRLDGSFEYLLDNTARKNTRQLFVMNMLRYPLGGMQEKYGFAHDLLLDAYGEYGFTVCLLLLVILIFGLVQLYRIMRKSDYSDAFKLTLLLVYVAILLEFMVEPILAGMQWLFACYCLINGCVTGMNRCNYRYKKGVYSHLNEGITD